MDTRTTRFLIGIGIIALIFYLKFAVFNKSDDDKEKNDRNSFFVEVEARVLTPQLLHKDHFVYFTLPSNSHEPGIVRYGVGDLIIQVHGKDYVWEVGKKPFPARLKYTNFGLKIPNESNKESHMIDISAIKKINQ